MERLKLPLHKFAFVIPFLILGIISITWFDFNRVVYFHDEIIPLSPESAINDYVNLWRTSVNLGITSTGGIPKLIPMFIFYIFNEVGLKIVYIEALLYFLTICFAGINAKLFFKKLNLLVGKSHNISEIIGGIAYILTPFIFFYLWRVNYIITRGWFYVFLPLLLFAFLNLIDKNNKKDFFKSGILFVISSILISPSFSHPSFFIMTLLGLLICYLIVILLQNNLLKLSLKSLLLVSLFIVINAYWLIPRFSTFTSEIEQAATIGLISTYETNSSQLSLSQNLLLTQTPVLYENNNWYEWTDFYKDSLFVTIGIFLLVFLALCSVFKKNIPILISITSFLGFATLMTGINEPFSGLKLFLFQKISLLQSFRDPGKWGFIGILFLAYLIGIGIIYIYKKISVLKRFRYIYIIVIYLTFITFSWPFFTGDLIPKKYNFPDAQIQIPIDYFEVAEILKENSANRPIIQFPIHGTHNAAIWDDSGYKGVDILRVLSGISLIDLNSNIRYLEMHRRVERLLNNTNLDEKELDGIMDSIGGKYIVINKDSDPKFVRSNLNIEKTISILDNLSFLDKVYESKFLVLYEKSLVSDLIYSPVDIVPSNVYSFGEEDIIRASSWELSNPRGISASLNTRNGLSVEINAQESEYVYIKNTDNISIDVKKHSYLLLKVNDISNIKILVSAQDSQGESSWLPNVNSYVQKKVNNSSDHTTLYFSLLGLSNDISTLRINIVPTANIQRSVNILSISTIENLFNDYSLVSNLSIDSIAYIDNEIYEANKEYYNRLSTATIKTFPSMEFKVTGSGLIPIVYRKQFTEGLTLFANNIPTEDYLHTITVNGYQQGWLFNIDEFCKSSNSSICDKIDNNYSVTLRPYYLPQSHLSVGIFISLSGVIILMVSLYLLRQYDKRDL